MKAYIITLYDTPNKTNKNCKESITVKSKHATLKDAQHYGKLLKEQDNWDRVMVVERQTKFSCGYSSLKSLIDDLKSNGFTDFSKVEFELDYGGCYYESDSPSIVAIAKE